MYHAILHLIIVSKNIHRFSVTTYKSFILTLRSIDLTFLSNWCHFIDNRESALEEKNKTKKYIYCSPSNGKCSPST